MTQNSSTEIMQKLSVQMGWLHRALRDQAAERSFPEMPSSSLAHMPLSQRQTFISRFERAFAQDAETLINVNEDFVSVLTDNNVKPPADQPASEPLIADKPGGYQPVGQMMEDISRELKRLDRSNSPLCLVNVALDTYDGNHYEYICELVGQHIVSTLRGFDDVYRLQQDEFLLSMKDIDILDAVTVIKRLVRQIDKMQADIEGADEFTVSAAVSMPEPEDDLSDTLETLRTSRRDAQEDGGNRVYEHSEKSPLARMMEQTAPRNQD